MGKALALFAFALSLGCRSADSIRGSPRPLTETFHADLAVTWRCALEALPGLGMSPRRTSGDFTLSDEKGSEDRRKTVEGEGFSVVLEPEETATSVAVTVGAMKTDEERARARSVLDAIRSCANARP